MVGRLCCISVQLNCVTECVECIAAGTAPCDILLLFAASDGDAPKVIELLAAGANIEVKVSQLARFFMHLKMLQLLACDCGSAVPEHMLFFVTFELVCCRPAKLTET